jgi:queuine tRNA-ribosyltransferase/7-cyano-7-deazaguanine tRNA-ribosyltransferase
MDIQHRIGADIMFAFDECTSPLNSKAYTEEAQSRTYEWLDRCITYHAPHKDKQALFAIIQGGAYEDLRIECSEIMSKKDVPGYGIGGSLGKTKEDMYRILDWTIPRLPQEKPRHLLGIGSVRDIFEGVERGVDLFDCVIPTREGRHGRLYTKKGQFGLRKLKTVNEVIDQTCGCFACHEGITLSKLWELYLARDPKFLTYMTAHNIWFFSDLMKEIRDAIHAGTFVKLKNNYLSLYP